MFSVQMDEDGYRIVGPEEEEGDVVDYGDLATLTIGEAIYYCMIEDPNSGEKPRVRRVDSVSIMPTQAEDVEFTEPSEGPIVMPSEEEDEEEEEEEASGDQPIEA